MCLVNGCEGVATGWSTNVPMFDPKEIIQNLLTLLNEEKASTLQRPELASMRPHYVGFKVSIAHNLQFMTIL
jgi:DNA topoisomerase-2